MSMAAHRILNTLQLTGLYDYNSLCTSVSFNVTCNSIIPLAVDKETLLQYVFV